MGTKFELVCFDLDGTLIEEDNGDILWMRMSYRIHEGASINKERYRMYKHGKLKLSDWANLDLSEWKENNITKQILIDEAKYSKLIKGARKTLDLLKKKGIKLAVISDSVDILLEAVFPDHPFDEVIINRLFFDSKGNFSHWKNMPYTDTGKDKALKMIAKRENIPLSKTVFVGDHINDISAAKVAGLSIAFNSKSKELNDVCDVVIEKKDLREIMKYFD